MITKLVISVIAIFLGMFLLNVAYVIRNEPDLTVVAIISACLGIGLNALVIGYVYSVYQTCKDENLRRFVFMGISICLGINLLKVAYVIRNEPDLTVIAIISVCLGIGLSALAIRYAYLICTK